MRGIAVSAHRDGFEIVEDASSLADGRDVSLSVFDRPADPVSRADAESLSNHCRDHYTPLVGTV